MPDYGMVVVFTADLSGSAPVALLNTAIIPAVKSDEPLPENPAGVARLEEAIAKVEQ